MSEREQRIRIAVVDDHEMFRAGVIATLQPYFDVNTPAVCLKLTEH